MTGDGTTIAFVLWHDGSGAGYDRCVVVRTSRGWRLEGTATLPALGRRAQASYRIRTDRVWAVAAVDVRLDVAPEPRQMRLERQGGRWLRDGVPLAQAADCSDVLLDFSPAGLTPLVRRLALRPGTGAEVTAVRVALPDLTGEPVVGRLECLAAGEFRWSQDGAASAVHVGAHGLVVEHEIGWRAVALG